jgi:hypothetical protein
MVLLLVSPSFVDSDYDWTKAERELRAKLDDWKGLLQRQVPQARQILKSCWPGRSGSRRCATAANGITPSRHRLRWTG